MEDGATPEAIPVRNPSRLPNPEDRLMPKHSAGVMLHRKGRDGVEVLLVHPGGPYWAKRDAHAWSIPKGEYDAGEDARAAARREAREETGLDVEGALVALGSFEQPSGKLVTAFACEGDFDPARLVSNLCEIEWPPRSGRRLAIPEVDRAAWFSLDAAREKLVKGQAPIVDALERTLARDES